MKPCDCCQATREAPMHPFFCPTCLWCGARLIQRIQALRRSRTPPTKEQIKARCRTVLDDWMAMGHLESDMRSLAAGPAVPLQPTGPDEPGASAAPTPTKPLSASKKPSLRRAKD